MQYVYQFIDFRGCKQTNIRTGQLPLGKRGNVEMGKCVSNLQLEAVGSWLAKTYVKWHKIKYPVVKMRFSDKSDAHVTGGRAVGM